MKRDSLLKQFELVHVLTKGTEKMLELDEYCREHIEDLCTELSVALNALCKKIKERQLTQPQKKVFSFSICVLRSRFLIRNGRIKIYAFDDAFYLDKEAMWVEWDAAKLFDFLWELEDYLYQCLNQYKGEITENDIKRTLSAEYVPYLIKYITELSRLAIRKNGINGLSNINVTHDFCVTSGEYKGSFDEVYITEKLFDNNQELVKLLKNYRKNNLQFYCKTYENMKVINLQVSGINFTKSNFYHMDMSNSNFDIAYILKTVFHDCSLKNTSWRGALLFDADFSNSDLSGADFTDSKGPITKPKLLRRDIFSFIGVDFTNTNLTNADLTRADFRGADFRNAIFKNTTFHETLLAGATFKKETLGSLLLTEIQLNSIRIID